MAKQAIEQVDVRTQIADYLKSKGIMQSWLADKADISNTHLHFILKGERELTDENRKAINKALETKF